jgi:hypothetical protein
MSVEILGQAESPEKMIEHVGGFGIDDLLLLRGQREAWPLLPNIARPLKTRDGTQSIPDLEQKLLSEFRRRALPHTERNMGDNLWEWLALAQHYGLPTRLLDWTTNPLAALWFAVREPPQSRQPGAVWLFLPEGGDRLEPTAKEGPFETKVTRVFRPGHITPRIIVQSGWFTVHRWKQASKRFIPLESNALYTDKIYRIDIPTRLFPSIREQLARLDIHDASMFPDLPGLATHAQWRYIRYTDE